MLVFWSREERLLSYDSPKTWNLSQHIVVEGGVLTGVYCLDRDKTDSILKDYAIISILQECLSSSFYYRARQLCKA